MTQNAAALVPMEMATESEPLTTAGPVALGNLQAQIDGLEHEAAAGRLTVRGRAGLVDLVLLRGHLFGRITDYEWADAFAEQLARTAPSEGDALLARARTRATFHRFPDALADLDAALRLGADPRTVAAERASVLQAVGRYDEALAIYRAAVDHRCDFRSLGDVATLYADCGEISAAERAFTESRSHYRGVSPIPLAQLDFRRAHMWMVAGDLGRARHWLEDTVRRLPTYAPAQGHLAEVEAALGMNEPAISRLRPVTASSDDPDYAAQLGRILRDVGCLEEAIEWRERAAARYDGLVARHLEAYADHAAEFWLGTGTDPQRALWLAQQNVGVRPTPRARELVARATAAGASHPRITA